MSFREAMDDPCIKEIRMCCRRNVARSGALFLAGAATLFLLTSAFGRAEEKPCPLPPGRSPACPIPTVPSPTPPELTPPPGSLTTPPATPEVQLPPETTGAGGETTVAFAAPNLIGSLLYTSRSVSFGFVRVNGTTDFLGLSSTSIVNASVAENNSPVPEDRVYFRYNFFSNAQSVTGLSNNTVFFEPGPLPGFPPALLQLPQTKKYDSNFYTFGVEKTFFDNRVSVELRAPVVTGLASHNTFSVGNADGPASVQLPPPVGVVTTDPLGNPLFNVTSTPQNTLGHDDTEFGDLTLILKGIWFENRHAGLTCSGGLGVTIPTGEDTHVAVIDYGGTSFIPFASFQRERDILIANETTSLSPFLAALYVPNNRLFTQGFAAVEFPVGRSHITYLDQYLRGTFPPPLPAGGSAGPTNNIFPPFRFDTSIKEQTLFHLDWNIGYWVYRAPASCWLSGIAPCFEVHYTSTLEDADRVQLPGDAQTTMINPANPTGQFIPETGPVVGGQRNRVDIVDLTLGSTFTFGDRTMLALAASVPVTSGNNKTYDWEFQVQLNYYFGHRRVPAAPPTQ
jgi:hypothetical protein